MPKDSARHAIRIAEPGDKIEKGDELNNEHDAKNQYR
jgi:hypothetical protein